MKKFPDWEGKEYGGDFACEDPTCEVTCECGHGLNEKGILWVSDYEIVRCPECGRGYKTEFVVWQFEKGET